MRFSATPPHPSLCAYSQQDRYVPLFSPSQSPQYFFWFPLPLAARVSCSFFSLLRHHSRSSFELLHTVIFSGPGTMTSYYYKPERYHVCHILLILLSLDLVSDLHPYRLHCQSLSLQGLLFIHEEL